MAGRGEEILHLAAEGFTDKEIAEKLSISVRTVEGHWRRLREQTGLPNRAGLLGHFLRREQLGDSDGSVQDLQTALAKLSSECEQLKLMHRESGLEFGRRSAVMHEEINRLYNEMKTLEEVAQDRSELNAIVLKSSVIAFRFRAEPPYKCLFMSDSIHSLGYHPQDFTSGLRSVTSLIHPEDFVMAWSDALEQIRSGTHRLDRKYRILSSVGEPRLVLDRCIYEPAGKRSPATISIFAFDITHADFGIGVSSNAGVSLR